MSAQPIPIPHVGEATLAIDGSHDVVVPGQPTAADLPLHAQVVLRGSVAADLVLRTTTASLLSLSFLNFAVREGFWHEPERLAFYRDRAAAADPALSFPRPAGPVKVRAQRSEAASLHTPGGHVELLSFESPFRATNPAMHDNYARYETTRTAWAQHWRHDDGPRPTLCVIHGFMAAGYKLNSTFFALPWFFREGYDILLYSLPFHGRRRSAREPFSGWGYFAHGIAHLNEAVAHAVHDFRLFLDHLERTGAQQLGVTGVSLGGYTAALLAAIEDRLMVSIPNAPVTEMSSLVRNWFPANALVSMFELAGGLGPDGLEQALAVHSPLNYPPLLDPSRLMIIGGLGDRLAPPEQGRRLWEHWGRPRLHWYPGNHAMHIRQSDYLREMLEFMRAAGFGG